MQRTVGPFGASVVVPTAVGAGLSRAQARGPGWRRTSRGFYVPVDTPRTPEQRIAEASVVVPNEGGLTGWAALRWMGGRWFDGTADGGRLELPVPVAAPARSVRPQPGIAVVENRFLCRELVEHDGLRLTSAVSSTCWEMRRARSVVEATVVADMAFLSDLTSLTELDSFITEASGRHGIALARRALELAHENSWSPMETRLRLLWVLVAGLPTPQVNAPVFDNDGRHLGTPDLLDTEAGLVVEFDGADHLERAQRVRDVGREDRLKDAGLRYLTVLGEHLHDETRLANRLARARAQALADTRPRAWTLDTPSWWISLDTVARRRAHGERAGTVWPVDQPLPVA